MPNAIGSADGPVATARFGFPAGIARDAAGNLYVADTGNDTIRKLAYSGGEWTVTTLAGLTGQASAANGVGTNARFNNPTGIAVDAAGIVYVADTDENRITKGVAASAPAPSVQFDTGDGGLTVSNGFITLRVTASSSSGTLVVLTSTNLQTWIPLQTNSLSGSPVAVSVPLSQAPRRFFRALLFP